MRTYYRRSRYYGPPRQHLPSQRELISQQLGGVDTEVVNFFFTMPDSQRELVFRRYRRFGSGAEQYARSSFESWRNGTKQISNQTLIRLLDIVPEVLDFGTRVSLYRRIRAANRHQEHVIVTVRSVADIAFIREAAARITAKARSQPDFEGLAERLTWLSQGDGPLARALVTAAEEQESKITSENMVRELSFLQENLERLTLQREAAHTISLPYGTITVNFEEPADVAARRKRNDKISSIMNSWGLLLYVIVMIAGVGSELALAGVAIGVVYMLVGCLQLVYEPTKERRFRDMLSWFAIGAPMTILAALAYPG